MARRLQQRDAHGPTRTRRQPNPVRPRKQDARDYERAMRRTYLNPMFRQLRKRLATAEGATQAYHAMDEVVGDIIAQPRAGVPTAEIQRALNRMRGYHRKRVIETFRAALGVDIRPVLAEVPVNLFMARALDEQVDLIKTIPTRMHDGLRRRLRDALEEAPFDQKFVTDIVRDEYKVSGFNLRRIVRDNGNKTIGRLTQIRQTQLGVDQFQWLTSQDEAVRPEHVARSGIAYYWSAPPDGEIPGQPILCRCVAIPIVTQALRDRLADAEAHSITGIAA